MTLDTREWLYNQTRRIWIQGFTQNDIAEQLHISEGTVNAFLKHAAESDSLLSLQRELALELKRTGYSMTQFASNFRYKNVITRMGPMGTKLDSVLTALDSKLVQDDSISPVQAADLIFECCSFMLKNQIPLKDLPQEISYKYERLNKIKAEIDHYDKLRSESEVKVKNLLEADGLTMFQIDLFTVVKAQLETFGFDFDSIIDLVNVMEDVTDFGGDAELLIAECKDVQSLRQKKKDLEFQCSLLEKNLEKYKARDKEERANWNSFYQGKLEFDALIRMGLAPLTIINIAHIVAKHPEMSLTRLAQEIGIYGDIESVNFKRNKDLQNLDRLLGHPSPVQEYQYSLNDLRTLTGRIIAHQSTPLFRDLLRGCHTVIWVLDNNSYNLHDLEDHPEDSQALPNGQIWSDFHQETMQA